MKKIILLIALLLIIGCNQDQPLIPDIQTEEHVHDSSCDHISPAAPGNPNLRQRPIVQVYYLEPRDQRKHDTVFDLISNLIHDMVTESQIIVADEMERRGYDRKTFKVRKNRDRKVDVKRMSLPDNLNFYTSAEDPKKEIRDDTFITLGSFYRDTSINEIRLFFVHTNGEHINACGFGGSHRSSGHAFILIGACMRHNVVLHELGHAFGLHHDFRNNRYIMSYGGERRSKLSAGAALWLDRHPAFNDQPHNPVFRPMMTNVELELIEHIKGKNYRLKFVFQSPFYTDKLDLHTAFLDRSQRYAEVLRYVPMRQYWRRKDGSYTLTFRCNLPEDLTKVELKIINERGHIGRSQTLL